MQWVSKRCRECNQKLPREGFLRQPDALSPFRWFYKRARQRGKKKGPTDLTPEYLSQLWAQQQGICPLTGWELSLPSRAQGGWQEPGGPRNASLDRVDNSRGYIKGNVRYTAIQANLARRSWTDAQLIEMAQAIAKTREEKK